MAASSAYLLLGPTAVTVGGQLIDLGPPQRRGVLARLALAPNRVVGDDALVEALWGEHSPPSARKAVQVQISKLRQALPDGAIERTGAGYVLRADESTVDAVRFEREVAAARRLTDAAVRADALRSALALWRGPALADLTDLPFAAPSAVRLDELRLTALDLRVDADLDLGRHGALVAELEGLVALHPDREPRWAQLIAALAGAGRQADALRAYERARRHLAEELGLDPGPSLQSLQRRVLDGDPTLLPSSRPAAEPAAARPEPSRTEGEALVGRDGALAALEHEVAEVATRRSSALVVVEGEEGFGKTALLTAFTARSASTAQVVITRAPEGDAAPFSPWRAVLEHLGAHDVLTGLADLDDDVEAGEVRRRQLFRGTADAVRSAARSRGPLVLIVDDLHWADEGSVRLLLHVLDEVEDEPLAVVVAWRPSEVRVGAAAVAIAERAAKRRSPRIAVGALTESEVAELLDAHRPDGDGTASRPDLARRIVETTGGVPLFVADVLATIDAGDADDRWLLPETARSITARRLTRAGGTAPEVASAASILAEPIAVEVLADLVPELGFAEVLDGIDRLLGVGLLVEAGDGTAFAHAAYRSAVRRAIPTGRRQVLHAHAFHRLTLEPVPAAAVAAHAEGGGRLVPPAEASAALARAGAEAAAGGAFADAVGFFERSVALAPAEGWAAAKVRHADALWRAGDLKSAKAGAAEVVERRRVSAAAVSDEVLADAVALHGTIGAGFGPDRTSIALITEALERVREPQAAARCAGALAYHLAAWGASRTQVWPAIDDARRRIDDASPPALRDELAFTVGLAMLEVPDLEARRSHAAELAERGLATGDLRLAGRGLRLLGMVQLSGGELDDLERTAGQVAEIAERTGSWMYESDVYRWRSTIAVSRGDLDGMRAAIADLDRLAADPLAGWVMVGTQHLLLRHHLGDLDGAMAFVEAVRTGLPFETRWNTDRMLAELYRVGLLLEMGEGDEARRSLDELRPWEELHLSSCRRYPAELALLASAVAGTGRRDVAPHLADLVAPYRGQHVVLGWGEGLLGTFEDRWQALQAVQATSEVTP